MLKSVMKFAVKRAAVNPQQRLAVTILECGVKGGNYT